MKICKCLLHVGQKRPQNVATQCNELLHCVQQNVMINIIITLCKVEFKLSLHPIT